MLSGSILNSWKFWVSELTKGEERQKLGHNMHKAITGVFFFLSLTIIKNIKPKIQEAQPSPWENKLTHDCQISKIKDK